MSTFLEAVWKGRDELFDIAEVLSLLFLPQGAFFSGLSLKMNESLKSITIYWSGARDELRIEVQSMILDEFKALLAARFPPLVL